MPVDLTQPVVTLEVAKTQINIELQKANYMKLHKEISELDYTEENIPLITQKVAAIRVLKNLVKETHQKGKAPYWNICKIWDNAKNDYDAVLDSLLEIAEPKLRNLCLGVEVRRKLSEAENLRVDTIKRGIEENVLAFSQRIAACESAATLSSLERLINLQKGNKAKYQEFLPEAFEKFTGLNAMLAQQKIKIRQLEALKQQETEAINSGDDEAILNVQAQKELLETSIEEGKINVQESAIESASATTVQSLNENFPLVKARRSVWRFEIKNIQEAAKKMPSWVVLQPDNEKINEYLKAKKAEGIPEGTEEFFTAGVRFYLDKTF